MSIATVSPEKYELQDLVCIELMLRFFAHEGAQMLVEPHKGEDGELRLPRHPIPTTIEVQVKGSKSNVGLDRVAEVLCHFPAYGKADFLLNRLYRDPNRLGLLVFSGRCDDSASVFVADPEWLGDPHPENRITKAVVSQLLDACLLVVPDGTPGSLLHVARKKAIAEFVATADARKLKDVLRRVLVLEYRRKKDVVSACHAALSGVPQDRLPDILNRILDHVAQCKRSRNDAYPGTRAIVADARGTTIRPTNYVERGDETQWTKMLSDERVLLLSGRTRVGKSDAARRIAADFVNQGYDVKLMFDVEAAARVLQQPGPSPRLVLLDDPVEYNGSQGEKVLRELDKLIKRLHKHDALIVCQGQERLLSASGRTSVHQVTTAGKTWIDASIATPAFQAAVWERHAAEFKVPSELATRVAIALQDSTLDLEPGCLTHLAAHHHRLPLGADLRDCARLAREDAETFAQTLRSDGCEDVLLALWVGSTPSERIDPESIAFVLGSGGDSLPGAKAEDGEFSLRSKAAAMLQKRIQYESTPVHNRAHEDRIEYLETHRILSVEGDGATFSHPFYRAAAGWATRPRSTASGKRLISALRRALFTRQPRVSRAAARNLDGVFDQVGDSPWRDAVVELAIEGVTRCRFIATRDLCLAFLLRHLSSLPVELQDDVGTWVGCTDVDVQSVIWISGDGYAIDLIDESSDVFELLRPISSPEVAGDLASFRRANGAVDIGALVNLIRYFLQTPRELSAWDAQIFLQRDEAAIRAAAAKSWLRVDRSDDESVLDSIFSDTHPSVAKAALEGCIRAWGKLSSSRRGLLLERLANTCSAPGAAAAVLPVLTVFGREEFTGSRTETPWEIFSATFPSAIRALPVGAVFNDARMYSVVEDCLDHLPHHVKLDVVDSVIGWVLRQAQRGKVLSDFQAGITTLLLKATEQTPSDREERIAKLLGVNGTAATLRIVADLIDGWEVLGEADRTRVLNAVAAPRDDKRWITAAALTRRSVPPEVAKVIAPDLLDLDSAASIMTALPSEVLDAAVRVFCGSPQPLWWIGTHHSAGSTWRQVIEQIACDGSSGSFEIAWSELIGRGESATPTLAKLVSELKDEDLDRLFNILLRKKVHTTGDYLRPVWTALFARRHSKRIPPEWRSDLNECLPVILDSLADLDYWLEKPYQADALQLLPGDIGPLSLIAATKQTLKGRVPHRLAAHIASQIKDLLAHRPIRLYRTCDQLLGVFRAEEWEDESIVAMLELRRKEIFRQRSEIQQKYDFDPGPLLGWLAP
ncbi:hypothetical protein [Variovorax sp. W6]|uniref:nSTAND3 domain-containing NTPase n=1 Tax=Variovorax sp. W6 TaxID=3093895 RepID=UPI003D802E44